MGKEFLHDLNIHGAGQIQFKNTAGTNAGKIDQNGNDLVLSNSVGDIIIGNGSDDVFIGDGTNTVDIRFEQNMAIFADSSSTRTLTLGGANTSLVLESPTINGSISLNATTINQNLIFTTANGHIVFDHETTDTGEYGTEVALLKIDVAGTEKTILSRVSKQGALALGTDDTVAITAGDTKSIIKANHNYASENIVFASEGGFIAYGFPNNDTTWSNRNVFKFHAFDSTAANNGLYIGDGGHTQFIDLDRNLKNIGTISSGNITATGSGNTALSVISTGGYSQLVTQSSDSDSAYIFFKDTSGERARLYSSTSNDLIFKTGGGSTTALTLNNSGNATFAGNITLSSNSNVVSARKFTARDGNGVMLTADDATSGLTIADNGNATFSGSVTATSLDINGDGDFSGNLNITGNITNANWQGDVIGVAKGGTGLTANTTYINANSFANFASSTADWDTITTRGSYRLTGSTNNPFGSAHSTGIVITQGSGDYGIQLFSSASTDNGTGIAYRYRGTSWENWQYLVTKTYGDGRYGKIASPTFTGTPRSTTASAGDNSTQIATTAFVTTAVSNLVDSAPSALNTLNELAAALGDDSNFSTTTATSLGNRVRVDTASQGLTSTQKSNARTNIGAGTSSFDGAYGSLSGVPSSFTPAQHTQTFSTITSTPTTLSGYGITDALPLAGGTMTGNLKLSDSVELRFGNSDDLVIKHNATNSVIDNTTGNLIIQNQATDGDIIFKSDDGSGGIAEYFRVDGSTTTTVASRQFKFEDDVKLFFGTGADSALYASSDDLIIEQTTADKDIMFKADGGSGSAVEYMRLDGSQTTIRMKRQVKWDDNIKATFGDSDDLEIYHDATNSVINNKTGHLQIYNNANDGDISFISDDGSGGTTEYFRVDGGAEKIIFNKGIRLIDNQRLDVGGATDGRFFHDGTDTFLTTITGDLIIKNSNDDGDIKFQSDDGSGGTATYFYLDGGNTRVQFNKDARFVDSAKIMLGTSDDLEIYHDGSNSYISDTGTGSLILKGNSIKVNDDGDGNATFQVDASGDIGLKVETGSANYIFGDSAQLGTGNFLEVQGGDSFDFKIFDSGTTTTKFQINPASSFTRHKDNVIANFGDGNDLQIYHAAAGVGGNSIIDNTTGDLLIRNTADNRSISILSDNGSGSTTTYVKANGLSGAVELNHYGSNKFATTATGISVTGDISVNGDIKGRSVPMVIHGSFDDTTSSTSNLIIPLAGSITETTVSGGYAPHFFTIPYACVLKKVIMKTVAGSMSSSFTTELKAYKNGSVTGDSSSGELTHSNSSITWNPTAHNDITYAAGDKFSLVYQKSATSKYWQDVAITIVFTLTNYDI